MTDKKQISTIPLLKILTKYAIKHAVEFSGVESNAIVEAMQEYAELWHTAKMAEVTDEDIEIKANDIASCISKNAFERGEWLGFKEGARAMRDGEIKHTTPA